MSTLFADTLKNQSGNGPTTLHKQHAAKAWINFDGSAVTSSADLTGVRDSFNIASIVDNSSGDHTTNFVNNMSNASYSAVVSSDDSGSSRAFAQSKTYVTSSFEINTKRGDNGSAIDKDIVVSTVHGDLA